MSGFSGDRILKVFKRSVVKSHLKQIDQIVPLIFFLTEILVSLLQRNTVDRDARFAYEEE